MKKKFTYYLPALLMLMACLGYTPTTRADIDPNDPFASIELTPAPGTVTDMSGFQTLTVKLNNTTGLAGGEAYISKFNTLTAGMLLQQKNEDGTWTEVGKYSKSAKAVDATTKTEWTVTLSVDITTKDLQPGEYRILTKSGSFSLLGGVIGTTAKNVPANTEWNYTYTRAAGEVAATVTPAKGTFVAEDDFTGFTVAFEGAQKVELMEETFDGVTFTRDGADVAVFLKNNDLTFGFMRGTTVPGLWELTVPAGFYKVTLEDGTEVDSPEISAYCYAGDSGFAVSPADGATRTWGSMGSTTVSVPSP